MKFDGFDKVEKAFEDSGDNADLIIRPKTQYNFEDFNTNKVYWDGFAAAVDMPTEENNYVSFISAFDYEGPFSYRTKGLKLHAPAEHTINGEHFEAELYIFHEAVNHEFDITYGVHSVLFNT